MGSIPGLGGSPGGGHGNSLRYSGLKNPMDRGAWRAIAHRVPKSWTGLKRLSMHTLQLFRASMSSGVLSQGAYNPSPGFQFSSVTQLCPTLCNPMNRSTPGLPVHHQLPEFTQTHVHRVSDAIQPSHPLASPSPPASNPSQHQSLFQ